MAVMDGDGDAPARPSELSRRDWVGVMRRTVREFREDELSDRAGALTYYGVLALFQALVALVSIVGFLGQSTINSLIANIRSIPAAPEVKSIIVKTIHNLSQHRGSAGIALFIGLVLALWSA